MIETYKKFILGFINVASKLIYNYLILKIISIYLGPSGIGIYSQFRSFTQFSTTITNLNSSALVIQRISSINNKNDFFNSSFILILLINILVSILIFFNADSISKLIFLSNNDDIKKIVYYSALIIPLSSLIIFLFSSLNGFKEYLKYTIASSIILIIYIFFICYFLINTSKLQILSILKIILIAEFISFIILLLFLIKKFDLKYFFKQNIYLFYLKQKSFIKNSSFFLISGLFFFSTILILKIIIINYLGYTELGIFEAAWSLAILLTFVSTKSFGFYYLPELSTKNSENISKTISHYLALSPIVILVFYSLYFVLSKELITIFFSSEFLEANIYLRWLLISELIKFYIFIFTYPIIAKNYFKFFLYLEIFFPSIFIILVFISIKFFLNIELLCIFYVFINLGYLLCSIIYVKTKFYFKFNFKIIIILLLTLFSFFSLSIFNWHNNINLIYNLLFIFISSISYLIFYNYNIKVQNI